MANTQHPSRSIKNHQSSKSKPQNINHKKTQPNILDHINMQRSRRRKHALPCYKSLGKRCISIILLLNTITALCSSPVYGKERRTTSTPPRQDKRHVRRHQYGALARGLDHSSSKTSKITKTSKSSKTSKGSKWSKSGKASEWWSGRGHGRSSSSSGDERPGGLGPGHGNRPPPSFGGKPPSRSGDGSSSNSDKPFGLWTPGLENRPPPSWGKPNNSNGSSDESSGDESPGWLFSGKPPSNSGDGKGSRNDESWGKPPLVPKTQRPSPRRTTQPPSDLHAMTKSPTTATPSPTFSSHSARPTSPSFTPSTPSTTTTSPMIQSITKMPSIPSPPPSSSTYAPTSWYPTYNPMNSPSHTPGDDEEETSMPTYAPIDDDAMMSNAPSTYGPTTQGPTTYRPTTYKPTTYKPTTYEPTTYKPATYEPTTYKPTWWTYTPTTYAPTTYKPTWWTYTPTTSEPTTNPTEHPSKRPVTEEPTTAEPTADPTRHPTLEPTTSNPTPTLPTTSSPTSSPTTSEPTTYEPTTSEPTPSPTLLPTEYPSKRPVTEEPTTAEPTVDPTRHPTLEPSGSPSRRPTKEPWVWPRLNDVLYPEELESNEAEGFFGASIAIDGHTLVVGIQDQRLGSAAVYRYSSSERTFVEEGTILRPSDGLPGDDYGRSVAISNDYILIGAQKHDWEGVVDAGAAYIYQRRTSSGGQSVKWVERAKLVPPEGLGENERFGISVAIHGGVAIVGANGDDTNGENSGSAYIFTLSETPSGRGQWVFAQKLMAPDGEAGDNFGFSVAVNGGRVVVSAVWDGDRSGSVYVYHLVDSVWTVEGKFTADGGGRPGDQFGWSVDIYDDTIAVGAFAHDAGGVVVDGGAVYVFRKDVRGVWRRQSRVSPEDGKDNDHFGRSVGLFEDWLVVSAPLDDTLGVDAGAVYVYQRSKNDDGDGNDDWILQVKQIPTEVEASLDFNEFGFGLGVSKDFFLMSSKYSVAEDANVFGNCYVYGTRRADDPTGSPTSYSDLTSMVTSDAAVESISMAPTPVVSVKSSLHSGLGIVSRQPDEQTVAPISISTPVSIITSAPTATDTFIPHTPPDWDRTSLQSSLGLADGSRRPDEPTAAPTSYSNPISMSTSTPTENDTSIPPTPAVSDGASLQSSPGFETAEMPSNIPNSLGGETLQAPSSGTYELDIASFIRKSPTP